MNSSKTGTGLGALAAVACVACCALPVLIAAGILSGGAAVFLADSMPAIAIGFALAAAAAFGWAAWRRSRRAAGCGGCGQGESAACSCATACI